MSGSQIADALDPRTLVAAYVEGWFPMDVNGEIGFYECDPRAIMPIEGFRVPRSVARALRRTPFETRIDAAFREVVDACGGERSDGRWLSPRLSTAYGRLFDTGVAHSVECWLDGTLAGGLFGVALGGLFTSESMFHRASDAGSAALVATASHLADRGYALWDIQMLSPHAERFGAVGLTPSDYLGRLRGALALERRFVRPDPATRR